MMKRNRWLMLLAALSLVAVACGGDGAATTTEGTTATTDAGATTTEGGAVTTAPDGGGTAGDCGGITVEEGATIVFSGWGDETEQQVYRDSITRFNEACPGVTVDYQPVPADFQTQMKAAFAGGEGPDVIYVDDSLMTALGRAGQLLPLDDYMAQAGVTREEFIPALLTIFTLDDQTYALPTDWGPLGLI
ncbi:MAG: ABC transporter substrate-binding protein, partial [Acidimicrobiia bacterium]